MFYSDFLDMLYDLKFFFLRCYKYNFKNNLFFKVKFKIKLYIYDWERMFIWKIYEKNEIKLLDVIFFEW